MSWAIKQKKLKSNCVFHKIFVVHCLLLQLIKVEAPRVVVEVVIQVAAAAVVVAGVKT